MLATQSVHRELLQLLKPIHNQNPEKWCITPEHRHGLHAHKARGVAATEHTYKENVLVIWVPRWHLLIIWTRINKPFSVQRMLLDLFHPLPLELKEKGTRREPGICPRDSAKRTHPEEKQGHCNLSCYCSAHFQRTKRILLQETEKKRFKQNLEATFKSAQCQINWTHYSWLMCKVP